MKTPFTRRDWFGLIAGVFLGVVFSRFSFGQDMTGPWLVVLFGPPIALLISSPRPILIWQVPIVTAALAATFMNPAADDRGSGALANAVVIWFLCSILSLPWALIFHYRNRRFRELDRTPRMPIAYVGMVALVFVCCALTFAGFLAPMFLTDPNDAQRRVFPPYGFLIAPAGIVLCIITERAARKLEVQKLVRGVFQVLMIPGVALGFPCIVSLYWFGSPRHPLADGSALCGALAGMEALAAMIWLTRLDRREQGGVLLAQRSSQ